MTSIGLAVGLASAGVAAAKAKKARDIAAKKELDINKEQAFDTNVFNKQYYQDISKRTEVQNMMRMLGERQDRDNARSDAQAAIMGATDEQQLAGKEANRRTYADALADIASNASNMRDQYLRDYKSDRKGYLGQRMAMKDQMANIEKNTSDQWATTATNAFMGALNTAANGDWSAPTAGKESISALSAPSSSMSFNTTNPDPSAALAGLNKIQIQ